jgi:hypothetical protein
MQTSGFSTATVLLPGVSKALSRGIETTRESSRSRPPYVTPLLSASADIFEDETQGEVLMENLKADCEVRAGRPPG